MSSSPLPVVHTKAKPRRRKNNVQCQIIAHRFIKTDLATGSCHKKRRKHSSRCLPRIHGDAAGKVCFQPTLAVDVTVRLIRGL